MAENEGHLQSSELPRRPWTILILGTVLAFLFFVGVVAFSISLARNWTFFVQSPDPGILFPIGRIAILGLTALGLFRRWKWSRWALCILLLIAAAHPFKQFFQGTGSMHEAEFAADMTPADIEGLQFLLALFWATGVIFLTCIVTFGSTTSEYFRGHSQQEETPGDAVG